MVSFLECNRGSVVDGPSPGFYKLLRCCGLPPHHHTSLQLIWITAGPRCSLAFSSLLKLFFLCALNTPSPTSCPQRERQAQRKSQSSLELEMNVHTQHTNFHVHRTWPRRTLTKKLFMGITMEWSFGGDGKGAVLQNLFIFLYCLDCFYSGNI